MELYLRMPIQYARGLAGVALQIINLPGTEVRGIDFDIFLPVEPSIVKSGIQKFAYTMSLPRSDDKIVRTFELHHPPHGFNIFWRVPPVTFGVKISHVQLFLQTGANSGDCARYLAAHKRLAPTRRLVIEQNSVTRE